ncbi:zinc-dependent peptidase [Cellulophaga sp. F20128]|uniref:zinc-dependent peptidase n=1 Tax=Cellulophaga sp. F20128 TaxID=2926413 RepID=UPI001FF4BAC7|nr:zinc-dependent peptidase [Cellulophaga sp. F20128]MCK0156246.1 zinc-dependent peptidase [Cellulophaga sp. F20128]
MESEFGVDVFGFVALLCMLAYLLYVLYYAIDLYFLTPSKSTIRLSFEEEQLIIANLPAYSLLTYEQKQKFKQRVSRFRANKKFVFAEKSKDDEKIKVLLSATAAFLMLGFKDYRIASIRKIMIYPSAYFSTITKQSHLGEYNPKLKTLVFSSEHLLYGFENGTDNLNLGVHEFAHALVFNFKTDLKCTAIKFRRGLLKMNALLGDEKFLERVQDTKYFREYGTTNVHEFFSVALENYVETPLDFKRLFPELFEVITRMLNFTAFNSQLK